MSSTPLIDWQQRDIGFPRGLPNGAADGLAGGSADRPVLRSIGLKIELGERVAILGESGVGKSSLLEALRQSLRSQVAWCPQQAGLVPTLSVLHNVYMGRLHEHPWWLNVWRLGFPGQRLRDEIAELLSALSLQHCLDQRAESLSGGQQQRCNIARALYQKQSVFIGDEPVSALDELQADAVLGLICERHDTVILALHDVELARRHCDRIIGLRGGGIAFDAPVAELNDHGIRQLYR